MHSSRPWNFFFSHLPAFIEAAAWGMFRLRAMSMDRACSAVVTVLPPGVFMTAIPRWLAAGMSMLSSPVPARPTTFRRSLTPIRSARSLVRLRTTSASNSLILSRRSSGEIWWSTTVSISGYRAKISTPLGDRLSVTSTRKVAMPHSTCVDLDGRGALAPLLFRASQGASTARAAFTEAPISTG